MELLILHELNQRLGGVNTVGVGNGHTLSTRKCDFTLLGVHILEVFILGDFIVYNTYI